MPCRVSDCRQPHRYTKDLILVDPDDELEISTVISFHGKAHVQYILDMTPLDEVCSTAAPAYFSVFLKFKCLQLPHILP